MGGGCGQRRMNLAVRYFSSLCPPRSRLRGDGGASASATSSWWISIMEVWHVCFWHKADVPLASTNVCCWGNSGHVLEMPPVPFLTQQRHWLCTAVTVLIPV